MVNQLKYHTTDAQLIPFTYSGGPLEEGAWVEDHQINIKLNKSNVTEQKRAYTCLPLEKKKETQEKWVNLILVKITENAFK